MFGGNLRFDDTDLLLRKKSLSLNLLDKLPNLSDVNDRLPYVAERIWVFTFWSASLEIDILAVVKIKWIGKGLT